LELTLAKKNRNSGESDAADFVSRDLLSRFRAGEDSAADAIFDRYVEQLLKLARRRIAPRLARRIDPDDLVQSAYRSFFVHARNGDYVLQRAGDLWRLLVAITLHKLYGQIEQHTAQRRDVYREEEVEADVTSGTRNEPIAIEPSPSEAAELAEQLRLAMERLGPGERAVLEMRLAGWTIEDMARQTNRSKRTVRRFLENARRRLEQQLECGAERGRPR
jgi:RNA polymerase sigma factor (sigma-70 family)